MASIECFRCKKKNSDTANYCIHCGTPIDGKSKNSIEIKGKAEVSQEAINRQTVEDYSSESDQAENQNKSSSFKKIISFIVFVLFFLICCVMCTGNTKKSSETACDDNSAVCIAEKKKLWSVAEVYCKRPIESLAKYSVKWTDKGYFERKFDRAMFKKGSNNKVITFVGDRIQFQNGFGAYTNYIYYCDVDIESEKVLDAGLIKAGKFSN